MTRYSLNDVIFDSELNTLSIGEQSVDLDPKLAELLLMLIANQGRVLSRDELLEQVWGKSIVSDNTINWSISQLRKALNDNAKEPLFIKTLPKKGYQFVAHVHTLDDSKSSIHDDSVIPKNRTLGTIFLAVAAASLSILLLFWFTWEKQAQDQGIDITSTYPLTSLPGHERSGGLSQDGLYLAFLHRPLDSTSFDVLLKPLRENKKLPVADASSQNEQLRDSRRTLSPYAINNDDYDYRFVIWGSDGYELLAVRGRNNSCEIVSLALTLDRKEVSQVRVLSDCTNTAATWLALDRDKTELFVVGDLVQSGRRDLYRLNLESGEVSSVLKSSTDGAGFRFVDVHRQTGELLLLEDLYYRETNFLAYHPKSNKKVLLQHIDSVYYTAYWSVEPNKVWHNWGNDKVVEFDVETKQLSLLLETTVGWNYDFRPVANDLAIYLVSDADSSNLQFFASNSTPKLTPTSYSESEPVYSPKGGKLAYVSNRSGIPQIWLKIGEEHSQLTDTQNFQEFYDIAWSNDESKIIAVSQNSIGLLDIEKNSVQILMNTHHKPFFPSVSDDASAFAFSEFRDNKWKVHIFNGDKQALATLENAHRAVFVNDTQLIYENSEQELCLYDISNKRHVALWDDFEGSSFWWELRDKELVYAKDNLILKCQILSSKQCTETSNHDVIAELPAPLSGLFSYDKSSGKVVIVNRTRQEVNIRGAIIK